MSGVDEDPTLGTEDIKRVPVDFEALESWGPLEFTLTPPDMDSDEKQTFAQRAGEIIAKKLTKEYQYIVLGHVAGNVTAVQFGQNTELQAEIQARLPVGQFPQLFVRYVFLGKEGSNLKLTPRQWAYFASDEGSKTVADALEACQTWCHDYHKQFELPTWSNTYAETMESMKKEKAKAQAAAAKSSGKSDGKKRTVFGRK